MPAAPHHAKLAFSSAAAIVLLAFFALGSAMAAQQAPEAPPAPPAVPAAPAEQGAPPTEQAPPTLAPAAPPAAAPGQQGDDAYLAAQQRRQVSIDPLGTRLVNVTTPVTTGPRGLELLITHRFREALQQSSSTDLYGLDSGADVGIGMTAGIGRNLDFSFYRSSFEADYELAGKLLLLRQGPHMPLSLAVRGGVDLPGVAGVLPHTRPLAQLLLSAQIAPGFTILVSPSWVSDTPTLRHAYNTPVGLTFPVPGKVLIELEAIPPNHALHGSQTAWHAAVSKQVGWHIFKIVFGNSRATTLDQMLGGDSESGFRNRDVRLGFNLIRYFFY
jgi:hypothetical protein